MTRQYLRQYLRQSSHVCFVLCNYFRDVRKSDLTTILKKIGLAFYLFVLMVELFYLIQNTLEHDKVFSNCKL